MDIEAEGNMEKSKEQKAAERVEELATRVPTTEQSARENAGLTRKPDTGYPSGDQGVSDTPRAAPPHSSTTSPHDFSHRGDAKIQGENVETTGDHRERRNEETHL